VRLVDTYTLEDEGMDLLWRLMSEREPHQNISHKAMPSWQEHRAFVSSRPYFAWYAIDCGECVGATYLTHQREVGIGILKQYRGQQYAVNALRMLIQMHPGRLLANINPANADSIRLFTGLGFKHIQQTYELA